MNFSSANLIELMQKDSSAKVLLLSNAVTIVFAVVFSWSLMIILWAYWLQSIIIGFFNFLKILTLKDYSVQGMEFSGKKIDSNVAGIFDSFAQKNQGISTGFKFFIAFFFAFHYGFFHLIYAVFLATFSFASFDLILTNLGFIFLTGIIFFFNHLFSFLHYKNKPVKRNIGKVMMFPYARILPMHLTIIFGGIFLFSGTFSVFVLILFLALKTAADLAMHSIEHHEQINN